MGYSGAATVEPSIGITRQAQSDMDTNLFIERTSPARVAAIVAGPTSTFRALVPRRKLVARFVTRHRLQINSAVEDLEHGRIPVAESLLTEFEGFLKVIRHVGDKHVLLAHKWVRGGANSSVRIILVDHFHSDHQPSESL
jgi:hypothetical protein